MLKQLWFIFEVPIKKVEVIPHSGRSSVVIGIRSQRDPISKFLFTQSNRPGKYCLPSLIVRFYWVCCTYTVAYQVVFLLFKHSTSIASFSVLKVHQYCSFCCAISLFNYTAYLKFYWYFVELLLCKLAGTWHIRIIYEADTQFPVELTKA